MTRGRPRPLPEIPRPTPKSPQTMLTVLTQTPPFIVLRSSLVAITDLVVGALATVPQYVRPTPAGPIVGACNFCPRSYRSDIRCHLSAASRPSHEPCEPSPLVSGC